MAVRTIIRNISNPAVPFGGGIVDFIDEIVPPNCTLVLKSFGNDVGNVALWTFAHWRFLKNMMPQFPMDDIYDPSGTTMLRQPCENIKWQGGSRFTLRAINDHAAITAVMPVSVEYDLVAND